MRRIDRGLYDKPQFNSLTKHDSAPDPRAVIDAVARRDQIRVLVDGMTAANDLGFTNAVPAKIVVHSEARPKSIKLGNLTIIFKQAAASKLFWAGRPAMRIVQALHWLRVTQRWAPTLVSRESFFRYRAWFAFTGRRPRLVLSEYRLGGLSSGLHRRTDMRQGFHHVVFDSAHRDVEFAVNLAIRHFLETMHGEDRASLLRQTGQSVLKRDPQIVRLQSLLLFRRARRIDVFVDRQGDDPASRPASAIDEDIASNAVEETARIDEMKQLVTG